ncbi:glycosyltransferase family 8 protein [Citricoccus nitrophenolicus]|uniref:glycosyltransferase family 8 protein n=1 Tax=Citricoccus nitrophenolicus TaxID=863575 RepID=UPI0031E7596F
MTGDNTVHVALCIDADFILPLAACLASLDAVSDDRPVEVHVVHPGLDGAVRERITRRLVNLSVQWIRVRETAVAGAHHSAFLSTASLYRLLLGEVLPKSLRRVLYLDADTIVASSIAPLYDRPLDHEAVVGAVPDAQSPWAAGPLGPPWQELGLDPSSGYFNSGVLLIDLERWRRDRTGLRCLELLRRLKPAWGDQDGLNTVLEGRWHQLPRRWNVQSADVRGSSIAWALWTSEIRDAVSRPGIMHYTEGDKPWLAATLHPESARWLRSLDRTAWAGWRPAEARPRFWHLAARTAAGFVRARMESPSPQLPA